MKIINADAIIRRTHWVEKIRKLSGKFGDKSEQLEKELGNEIKGPDTSALLDHLRLCGNLPESYIRSSSAEKLYSKYTDSLLAEAFKAVGLKSLVLKKRGATADVEVFATSYSFVADAKSFRLSRTAKNQKDFKVQSMDDWKHGKSYAMVVCPIYQLPNESSQIYEQATTRNVCIFSYSHLAMLVSFSLLEGKPKAEELLHEIFKTISALNPSTDALTYWLAVNQTMLRFSDKVEDLWKVEKQAAVESIAVAKEEALATLANEREKIMRMGHEEALLELVKVLNIENKIEVISSMSDNGLLEIR